MVYRFFDKKSASPADKSTERSGAVTGQPNAKHVNTKRALQN